GPSTSISVPFIAPAAAAMVGLAMLVWSKRLGAILASGLETPTTTTLSTQQALQVGTALLGLFFCATAVSDIVAAAWDYFGRASSGREAVDEMRMHRAISYAVNAITKLVLGAILLWMARGAFAHGRDAAAGQSP